MLVLSDQGEVTAKTKNGEGHQEIGQKMIKVLDGIRRPCIL